MTVTFPRLDAHVTHPPIGHPPALADDGTRGLIRHLWIDRDNPHAAHNARNAAMAAGWDWHLSADVIDDLVSVVDALCVNAIIHAKWTENWTAVPVAIEMIGRRIIVEVRDSDPTLPVWPGAHAFDIAALLDDPDVDPDDPALIHRQGLVDVAGRAELSAFAESVGKVVRAVITIGGAS
jgi:hypothetical protein